MDSFEVLVSKAEIAYKSGQFLCSVNHAKSALRICSEESKAIALKIFIARTYSKLGCYDKSNTIYRGLLKENVYMPPVVMGLLYNNFKNPEKQKNNLRLIKLCLHLR